MSDDGFDMIVVGAGLAGLCCAGELVRLGARPLLISETREVGFNFRSQQVGANRGTFQHLWWHQASDTGWYPLARQLDIPLRFYPSLAFSATIRGSGVILDLPLCSSASALTSVIEEAFPIPLEGARDKFEAVMHAALAIPDAELVKMHHISLGEWLEDQGADELVTFLFLFFCGNIHELTTEEAREHLSVFGALHPLRGILCAEAAMGIAFPDIREGLCIPLAREIERRGGEVWRGRRVQQVLVEGEQVRGVVFADGTEVRSPIVAIATGNSRIPSLLDPLPAELEAPLAYSARYATQDFCSFAVLDKPVVPSERERNFIFVCGADGSAIQVSWPLHAAAPWTTEAGKQFVLSQAFFPNHEAVAAAGGEEAIYASLHSINEELYPGYGNAIVETATQRHQHHWVTPVTVGPKLTRTIPSVKGLWFVGDGSVPTAGMYTEGAASGGVLGARAMLGRR